MLGKLNTHEFAYGALTTSPHFGPARNPWSPDRVCGGSSGGSGAAAAADLAAGTLGTDTAGSIRIPACFCGVTGLRPTLGLVPNQGVVPTSWTFDTVGPIARSAEDCSLLLEATRPATVRRWTAASAISASASSNTSSTRSEPDIAAWSRRRCDELARSARTSSRSSSRCSRRPARSAARSCSQRQHRLTSAGCARGFPTTGRRPRATARRAAPALDRLRRRGCGLGAGTDDELRPLFGRFDLLVRPAMPVIPPRIGEETVELHGRGDPVPARADPVQLTLERSRAPRSQACRAASSRTARRARARRPPSGEATVLRAAHAFQHVTDWHDAAARRDGVRSAFVPIRSARSRIQSTRFSTKG